LVLIWRASWTSCMIMAHSVAHPAREMLDLRSPATSRSLESRSVCPVLSRAIDHLFTQCVFVREIWFKVFRRCGWQHLTPSADALTVDWWLRSHMVVEKPRRHAFDSLVCLVIWLCWLQRNDREFHTKRAWKLWCCANLVSWSLLLGE
jgi:hypothetical protein